MTRSPLPEQLAVRLAFLANVVRKEAQHLATTDQRLFAQPFTVDRTASLEDDPDLAERVDAFVSRFGRLQDSLGDKLLPLLLVALGEKAGAAIDNLDRAECLGLIESAEDWMTIRKLRNQMVHEYIEDPEILSSALNAGHQFVAVLRRCAKYMLAEIVERAL